MAVPEHVSQKSKTRGRCPESSWKQELALRQLQIQACLYTCLKQIPPGLSLMLTVCGTRSRHEGSIPALYRTLVPCSCVSISDPEFSTLEFTWRKPCMLLCCSAGLGISLSCGKDNVLDMRICIRILFAAWHDFFGTFYPRNRAL